MRFSFKITKCSCSAITYLKLTIYNSIRSSCQLKIFDFINLPANAFMFENAYFLMRLRGVVHTKAPENVYENGDFRKTESFENASF